MLETRRLSYRIKQKILLSSVSFSLRGGHLCGILGPNGAGKTSLFKLLTGLWIPSEGEVIWNGRSLVAMERTERARTITLVPQNPSPLFQFTVKEIVEMGTYMHRNKGNICLDNALHAVGIEELVDKKITEISSGERQRVYVARALATESPIILLDEPTANLDVKYQKLMWTLMRELADSGKCVCVSTHDLEAAYRYCDTFLVLKKGGLYTYCPPVSIHRRVLERDVFDLKPEYS
ncbi:MAG: hypothetical protein Tsb0021_11720 [Chlamydiales bacterium]